MRSSQHNDVFSNRSVIRKVYRFRHVAVLAYLRALMLQALQPVALVGLFKDSAGWDDIAARAKRTMVAMETVFFGDWPTVRELVTEIHRMHKTVKGKVGPNQGDLPENTAYSALDPRLQRWVIATLIDSAIACYEMLVEDLTASEKDQLVGEFKVVAKLFHVPETYWFATHQELQEYMRSMYGTIGNTHLDPHHRLEISAEHQKLVIRLITSLPDDFQKLLARDLPRPIRDVYSLGWTLVNVKPGWKLALKGILPAPVRYLYGLNWTTMEATAFQSMVGLAKSTMNLARTTEKFSEAWQEGMMHVPVLSWTGAPSRLFTKLMYMPIQGPIFFRR